MRLTKIKNIVIITIILIICTIIPLTFAGCNKASEFIGSYHSIYVDMNSSDSNYAGNVNFNLEIKKDGTFMITSSDPIFEKYGSYTTITENGKTLMLCFLEKSKDKDGIVTEMGIMPYFQLAFDDNGRLLATPEIYVNYESTDSAFGVINSRPIQLVIFERNK